MHMYKKINKISVVFAHNKVVIAGSNAHSFELAITYQIKKRLDAKEDELYKLNAVLLNWMYEKLKLALHFSIFV